MDEVPAPAETTMRGLIKIHI